MRKNMFLGAALALLTALAVGCAGDVPPDEALARLRQGSGYYAPGAEKYRGLGPGADKGLWKQAAEEYYRPAQLDYFKDMDAVGSSGGEGAQPLALSAEAIKGRNAWAIWAAGNEAWWDWLARYGYGTIDLMWLLDPDRRDTRFARTGLVNEPGTRLPSDAETAQTYGVRFARPIRPDDGPCRVLPGDPLEKRPAHVEYRPAAPGEKWYPASSYDPGERKYPDEYPVYGYPTGVVGLRLFPNPDFFNSSSAQKRWEKNKGLYYDDGEKGTAYRADPDTVRPYRVGMSCGFCHIAPHPLNPPAHRERPEWANLSNNVGNQFIRIRGTFGNALRSNNYLYHVFDSQLPGAVDTSAYPSDNNNNPNTINSFYGLRGRVARSHHNPAEALSASSLGYIRRYEKADIANPQDVPRVLLDGSDSVGLDIALSRVYLNIGTHHQQWIRVQNPILGFRKQDPFKLNDIAGHSLYWHATLLRVQPMVEFFLASTDPQRLRNVVRPADAGARKKLEDTFQAHLRGTGLPWYTAPAKAEPPKAPDPKAPAPKAEPPKAPEPKQPALIGGAGDYAAGRAVFAKGCIACHSSVQPGDLPELEALVLDPALPGSVAYRDKMSKVPEADRGADEKDGRLAKLRAELAGARQALRLTADDRFQLTRGTGQLPPGYAAWARLAVEQKTFWEYEARDPDGKTPPVTVHNYLSIDERVPVTVTRTNSARAAATNARHEHVWEDFASQTYKELPGVGPIRYHDPFSRAEKTYSPRDGGPGYYRVPTLISIWATAPFLHNNALGTFNNGPEVDQRLASFDDSITRLLWPAARAVPSEQWYWDGEYKNQPGTRPDAWFPKPQDDQDRRTPKDRSAAQRAEDNGWIWRTTDDSWLTFAGGHVPRLVGGVLGLSDLQTDLLPWAPAGAFLVLGLLLLSSERLIRFRETYLMWLWWLLRPIWWALAVVGLVGVAGVIYLAARFWPLITLLDIGTLDSIWGFRVLAVALPAGFFGLVSVLFSLYRVEAVAFRRRLALRAGALALVLAVLAAVSVGPFLAGHGKGVRLGPIPEGTPINTLANIDPESSLPDKLGLLNALGAHFLKYKDVKPGEMTEARRAEFDLTVGPALIKVSKSPDYVTDRGHDYEFIRRLSDEEKRELIALLKTF
ncbi:hypothetical protein R5W23_000469 [Gemmata sp. JC673]|uniref:Cytochrome c domain-containing protein n=1 Tax=Gemmata algarum TaxID=2975278 RepID=A0ABU5EVZ5_9BACT|nr:hypothetical protein [Gemmata algarum]MDY3559476.1 hypothetical protein [Gemmata algarum]